MKKIYATALVLAFVAGLTPVASAQDAEEIRDAAGRILETVDENGLRAVYIYDEDGNLLEIRYSDGRVVRQEPIAED